MLSKYAKKLSNDRYNLSEAEIENLTQAVMTESQNIGKGLYNSTVDALTKAGETGDVDAIAKALVSVMQGAPLNEAEQTLVANSKLANMAVSEANKWTGKITFKKIKEGSKKQDTTFKSRSEALKEKLRAEKANAESTASAESGVDGEVQIEKENTVDFADMQSVKDYIKTHPLYKDFNGTTVEEFKEYKEYIDTISEDSKNLKGEDAEAGGFTDSADKDIYREKTNQEFAREAVTGKRRNTRQRQAEKVAELFGVKIWWNEGVKHAYYNFNTHYIFMNPNLSVSDMYVVIFKHELVHHFELKKGYDGFKNYLFKNSSAFADYVKKKLQRIEHGEFKGTVDEAIKAYTEYKYNEYMNSDEVHPSAKSKFTMESAEMEIVADFVGERLLFGKNVDQSMKALTELAQTYRNLFQRIWDWVKDKLASLKKRGDTQDASIIKDLEYLNNRLGRVWDSKNKETSANGAEVKYKISDNFYKQIDAWDGKTVGFSFIVGEPSEAIQMAGVPKKQIRWDATKIKNTLSKHDSGMDIDVIKRVPEILESPIVVVDSKTVEGRKVVLGEVYDNNEKIVVVALELNPSSNSGKTQFTDIIKIATSQGRSHIQSLLDGKICYVDPNEKRVQNWLNVNRLQLPLRSTNQDPIDRVAQNELSVNSNSMQNSSKDAENNKNSIGLAKDAVFEPDTVAGELTEKYGKSSMENDVLTEQLGQVMSAVDCTKWSEAYELAQIIAQSFEGADVKTIADDIYNRTIDVRDTQVWVEIDTTAKQNAEMDKLENARLKKENKSLREKAERNEKRINELEGKELDSQRYHEQMVETEGRFSWVETEGLETEGRFFCLLFSR